MVDLLPSMHKTLNSLSNIEPNSNNNNRSKWKNKFKCISYNPPKLYLILFLKTIIGAIWMVQWVKAFALKPDDLSGPGTCLVEGQTDQLTQVVL